MNAWATTLLALHALWAERGDAALELARAAQRDFRDDGGVAVANALAVQAAVMALRDEQDRALALADEALALLARGPVMYFMWPACDALMTGLFALWQNAADAQRDVTPVRRRALAASRFARAIGQRSKIGRPIALRAEAGVARLEGRSRRARALVTAGAELAAALQLPIVAAQLKLERARLEPPLPERAHS